jgi:CHAT domain-containing protein
MPLFFTPRLIFFTWLFQVPTLLLLAQPPADLHSYDAQIAHFQEKEQQDSFFHYVQLKCALAQKADSLELWAWQQFDAYEAFETTPAKALQNLDAAWQNRWREPRNAGEWLPFLYIQCSSAWCLFELGKIFQSAQTFELAAKAFEQFQYPDFDAVQFLYKPLGNNYIRLGDDDKALSVFQKALAIGGDHESLSGLYCDIGLAYWNKGDPVAAEDNFRHGLSLNGVSSLKRALLLGALAQTQLDEGQTEASAVTAAQSLALLQKVKSERAVFEYRCYSRRTAGIAHTRLGRHKEAEQLLSGALADALMVFGPHSRDVGKIEVARAQLELSQNKPIPAIHAANRALAAVIPGFKPGLTNPQAAQFYEENTIFETLTVKAAAAQALFEKTGELHWLELSLECHDLAWQAESMLRRVFQYSSSKLNLQKDARAREEAAMNVARMLFEKTGQAVWLEKAFAITERSKATILLEALQDNLLRQHRSGNDTRFEDLNILRQSLSYFDKNLLLEPGSEKVPQWRIESDGIRAQITTLEQALRKAYPNLAGFETPTANWLPASGDLSAGEALVGYFMSVHWVDVFVFQKDQQAIWHRIPNDATLQSLIHRYLAFFANDYAILNDPGGYFQTAYTLWQKLLPPETVAASILTILPDGILNFVPFEALVTALDASPTLRNAAYLLRKQEVRYAWSLAVLRQQKDLKSRAPNYMLSIAPGFANHERGLAPLATTDFDWRGISGWDIQKLEGQHADLQHFLKASSEYRVLHFSTHAFAGGNPRIELMDGSLLLPDLYALPLQADLVMLSACETGLGKEAKGEGVMSLARAFAQAGAACIVSSLWSVNDQSTARLLRYFYDNIKEGQSSASALRSAKLAYLSDAEVGSTAQSPYFWAGLVMVGDDRVVEQPGGWGWWGILLGGVMLILCLAWYFQCMYRKKA